ncbi:MAG TPA: SgcJ/EcaC family oxidoreductase [Chthoniobacterales bacterium]|nr:SgcJ/EcaC family oxidoreductase [Chthoniobacterales bacterium]
MFSDTDAMKRLIWRASLIGAVGLSNIIAADRSADETAIRALEARQPEAWNKHDAKAYASLFTNDGDIVNVVGWWWKGKAEIEKKLTDAFVYVFKESTLTITHVDIRFLTSDVAVAHVQWTMTGARTPSGIPVPQQGIQTHVLQKENGQWLIGAFQNTNSVPEMPFSKGPVAPSSPTTPKP